MTDSQEFNIQGIMNKVLRVDLTTQQVSTEDLDKTLSSLFFGGRGLGVAYLFQHFQDLTAKGLYANAFADVDPLSPDNVIVISTSPTTGTRMPTTGRVHMNYKSPATGGLGSTNAGGRWSVDFKRTGHDVLIITGHSKTPVYLVITDSGVQFQNASEFIDLNSIDTREQIRQNLSKKAQVLTIGIGGKKQSMFSAVMSDKGKALGRGGGGAVFGAKNLYAVAVLADPGIPVEVADPERLRVKNRSGAGHHAKLKLDMGKFTRRESAYGILSSMGSLGLLGMVDNFNQLIHNNMKDTCHDPADIAQINGEALRNHDRDTAPGKPRVKVKKGSCFNCPIICKRETQLIDGDGRVVEKGEGPEFESVTLLGANLSIYDLAVITPANYLANHYGLDTISLGSTIAAFFELYQLVSEKSKSELEEPEVQFLQEVQPFVNEYGEPAFGKAELLIPLIHLIGNQEGIGSQLAQGSYRFCSRYGHPEFSMSIKKLELPAYDPRTSYSQALCYEMNNRGGCHLEGGYTAPHAYCAGYGEWPGDRTEGTPLVAKNATLKNVTLDVIGVCTYGSFSLGLDEYASLICAVTGHHYNSEILKTISLRTITLERSFNTLCGLTEADDWLPDRFYNEPIIARGKQVICDRKHFKTMHEQYYHSVGWDKRGIPLPQTLEELRLDGFFQKQSIRELMEKR